MDDKELKLEIFKTVNEHYRQDFQLHWLRSNFFLLVEAGLFSLFSSEYLMKSPEFQIAFSIIGIVISVTWFLVSISSVQWINIWRNKVVEIDKEINPYQSFAKGEDIGSRNFKFHLSLRPDIIPIILPVAFFCLWSYFLIH